MSTKRRTEGVFASPTPNGEIMEYIDLHRPWAATKRAFIRRTSLLKPPDPPDTYREPAEAFCHQCGRRLNYPGGVCPTCLRESERCTCLAVDYPPLSRPEARPAEYTASCEHKTLLPCSPVINASPVEKKNA
jgi:hypothetical protein